MTRIIRRSYAISTATLFFDTAATNYHYYPGEINKKKNFFASDNDFLLGFLFSRVFYAALCDAITTEVPSTHCGFGWGPIHLRSLVLWNLLCFARSQTSKPPWCPFLCEKGQKTNERERKSALLLLHHKVLLFTLRKCLQKALLSTYMKNLHWKP